MLLADLYIHIVMGSLLFFTSIFMIFLILIQRGRGGGLAGALGGSGGSSAFGAKAGDTFTRVTAGMAVFWFVLCLLTILFIQGRRVQPLANREPAVGGAATAPATPGSETAPVDSGVGETGPAAGETAPGTDVLPELPALDLPSTTPPSESGTTGETAGETTSGSADSSAESSAGETGNGDAGSGGL